MKDKGVQQLQALTLNSEAIEKWKVARHPPSSRVVVCDYYSF